METRYLETLLATVETGSFSRAAELLHLTQSAVSQRVKFLEEQFGHTLLERGPLLKPTPAGEVVVARARDIVAAARALHQEMAQYAGGEKRLSICCTPTFGLAFLPTILNDFMPRHADLTDFRFLFQQPEQALRGLQERSFDLAIVEHCNPVSAAGIEVISLQQDEVLFVSAPSLGLPVGTIGLDALRPFRLYARRDGCSSKELLIRNLQQAGQSLDAFAGVIVSDDLRLTLQEVAAGRGVAFVSSALAAELLTQGALRSHRVEGFTHARQRSLLVHRDQREAPLVLDFMKSVCRVGGEGSLCR